jgi:hypothetical protein
MKKILLFVILSLGTITASHSQSFTLKLFFNLEKIKCQTNLDGYILRTDLFESKGQKNGVKTFMTYSNVKDLVTINTFSNRNGYYLGTTSPDIYNFIKKQGQYLSTESDSRGTVNLVYLYNNKIYWLSKEEPFKGGRLYYISSDDCD